MPFIIRNKEVKYLNTYYERTGSQIIVMYGAKGVGKQAILNDFLLDKPSYYYKARPASEREQLYQWGKELTESNAKFSKYPDYDDIFTAITEKNKVNTKAKKVLLIDDFQFIIKNSPSFISKLVGLAHGQWKKAQVLVILLSSQVGWVENCMVARIGEQAYELSGFLKVKELNFCDITAIYHKYKITEAIETYAILGGNPGMWQYFDETLSVEKNICKNILAPQAFLHHHSERIVADELRETGIYNTILSTIAEGHHKLNDLYVHTGFSRAKISVYLKNLMELGLVEKVFSFTSEKENNTGSSKGYYRIANPFVHFHFTYLYPYQSDIKRLTPNEFYQKHISPTYKSYVANYYKSACISKLELWNKGDKLPFKFTHCGQWQGSIGTIDIVANDSNGKTLIGLCNFEKPLMTYDDYEWLLFCAAKANLSVDYIYLFSAGRFDEKLNLEAKVKQNIYLIGANDL
ncbi:MAG: ArsR family transcriptional regulator [Lachnospiraceae bacterium]|nr:ArsR family transcriptional regulator [Lachnospiraceae bacterium]